MTIKTGDIPEFLFGEVVKINKVEGILKEMHDGTQYLCDLNGENCVNLGDDKLPDVGSNSQVIHTEIEDPDNPGNMIPHKTLYYSLYTPKYICTDESGVEQTYEPDYMWIYKDPISGKRWQLGLKQTNQGDSTIPTEIYFFGEFNYNLFDPRVYKCNPLNFRILKTETLVADDSITGGINSLLFHTPNPNQISANSDGDRVIYTIRCHPEWMIFDSITYTTPTGSKTCNDDITATISSIREIQVTGSVDEDALAAGEENIGLTITWGFIKNTHETWGGVDYEPYGDFSVTDPVFNFTHEGQGGGNTAIWNFTVEAWDEVNTEWTTSDINNWKYLRYNLITTHLHGAFWDKDDNLKFCYSDCHERQDAYIDKLLTSTTSTKTKTQYESGGNCIYQWDNSGVQAADFHEKDDYIMRQTPYVGTRNINQRNIEEKLDTHYWFEFSFDVNYPDTGGSTGGSCSNLDPTITPPIAAAPYPEYSGYSFNDMRDAVRDGRDGWNNEQILDIIDRSMTVLGTDYSEYVYDTATWGYANRTPEQGNRPEVWTQKFGFGYFYQEHLAMNDVAGYITEDAELFGIDWGGDWQQPGQEGYYYWFNIDIYAPAYAYDPIDLKFHIDYDAKWIRVLR